MYTMYVMHTLYAYMYVMHKCKAKMHYNVCKTYNA